MSKFARVLVAVLLFSPMLIGAEDLTGTWAGTFVVSMDGGEPRPDSAHMVLKQTGTALTGTAGPNVDQQWPIVKGTVEGAKATFDVEGDGPLMHFELTLVEGHLKGQGKAEQDGRTMSAILDLQRKVK